MKKVRYVCKRCGHRFEVEILEREEIEEKKIRTVQVSCPKCHWTDLARD